MFRGGVLRLVCALAIVGGVALGVVSTAGASDKTLNVSVTGPGTVTSDDGLISCTSSGGPDCSEVYELPCAFDPDVGAVICEQVAVILTRSTVAGWTGSWGDYCEAETTSNCEVGMSGVGPPATRTVSASYADTTAPTVALSAPADGALYAGDVPVSASASDGQSGVQGVQFYLDNVLLFFDTAAPYGGFNWESTTTADGSHMISARAVDNQGNQSALVARTFTTDNTDPRTRLQDHPNDPTRSHRATFRFRALDAHATTFTCKLDGRDPKPCSSPKTYRGLSHGRHVFRVYATDAAGNVDETPVVYRWRIVR